MLKRSVVVYHGCVVKNNLRDIILITTSSNSQNYTELALIDVPSLKGTSDPSSLAMAAAATILLAPVVFR